MLFENIVGAVFQFIFELLVYSLAIGVVAGLIAVFMLFIAWCLR